MSNRPDAPSDPRPGSTAVPCPSCGAPATGKYCGECGSALLGVSCRSCRALLTPGARFCHRCGIGVSAAAAHVRTAGPPRSVIPWVVAGAALVALVIMVAAQQAKSPPAGIGETTSLGGPTAMGGARAPDISNMPPRERADRLFDRVMTLSAQGKTDSAAFFASMAVGAYEALAPLDLDLRYDYGRMAEMAGDLALAQSQADSILGMNPDHLLGLILSARVAQARNDLAAYQRLITRVAQAQSTELAKSLDEYTRHRIDIDAAVAQAKRP
jgi:hypothetical protein